MRAPMRVGLAQINVTVGNIEGNYKKIMDTLQRASERAVDLVIFPELALSGYPPEDLLLNKQFIAENMKAINQLERNVQGITAIVGFPYLQDGRIYNSAAILGQDRGVKPYCKVHLPNYGVFDEKRYFVPGIEPSIYEIKNYNVGLNICEDMWEKSDLLVRQKNAGADFIVNISASPFHSGKKDVRNGLIQSRAIEGRIPILLVNLVGGQDELVFDGNSLIVDEQGRVVTGGRSFEEGLVVVDVSGESGDKILIVPQDDKPEQLSGAEEIFAALTLGIKDYVVKNGFSKVTLGISGGIDSSVVASLAVQALGKGSVTGISMPSPYSSEETKKDAELLSKNLGIGFKVIPVDRIFDSYLQTLEPHFKGLNPDLAEENIQARIRGNILMALSNKFGWIVLATGNKSEISVGYSTLYGDLSGGFAPIKDVPKMMVYEIARLINKEHEIIPRTIIDRPPSAELRPGQKDTDSLPPYEVLDAVLQGYVEEDLSVEDIASRGFEKELVAKVINMVDKSEYKRRQAPPGIKITPRAFGRDRRFPITNKFRTK